MDALIRLHYQARPNPILLALLAPFELAYSTASALRNRAYQLGILKQLSLPVPVVSIGNLTTGGTGKTPVVAAVSEALLEQGKRVVILSRGYGASAPQAYARATKPAYGDEPFLLQQRLPEAVVLVGKNRRQNALHAIEDFQPDVILLDDGFQYQGLARAFNVLLMDGHRLLGNGHQLPAGPLREAASACQRADFVGLTRLSDNPIEREQQLTSAKALQERYGVRSLPVEALPFTYSLHAVSQLSAAGSDNAPALESGRAVFAVSGIAQPQAFLSALEALGHPVAQQQTFADHFIYQKKDLETLLQAAKHADLPLVTTEKDWVKWQVLLEGDAALTVLFKMVACSVLRLSAQLPPSFMLALERALDA